MIASPVILDKLKKTITHVLVFLLETDNFKMATLFSVSHGSSHDDEARFWINGYLNKQNCRFWSDDNPQTIVETPSRNSLRACRIIGLYIRASNGRH